MAPHWPGTAEEERHPSDKRTTPYAVEPHEAELLLFVEEASRFTAESRCLVP